MAVGGLEPLQECKVVYGVERSRQVQLGQDRQVSRVEDQKDVSNDFQHSCLSWMVGAVRRLQIC